MPLHRVKVDFSDDKIDKLEEAVKKIEAKGLDIAEVLSFHGPVGEWVIVTRRGRKLETRRQP